MGYEDDQSERRGAFADLYAFFRFPSRVNVANCRNIVLPIKISGRVPDISLECKKLSTNCMRVQKQKETETLFICITQTQACLLFPYLHFDGKTIVARSCAVQMVDELSEERRYKTTNF